MGAGVGVASGCEEKSPQAVMASERRKANDKNIASLFERFMSTSFFEESNNQLYKQAALMDGLLVIFHENVTTCVSGKAPSQ